MRIHLVSIAVGIAIAGCAVHEPVQQPAAPAAPSPPTATNTVATLEAAQKAGYKIVNEDGKTLYCREQLKTGSHLLKERICLTEEELAMARDATTRNLEQMRKAVPPPQGK